MPKKFYMKILTKGFWDLVLCKIIETILSFKFWVVIFAFKYGFWLTQLIIADKAWNALPVVATVMTGIIVPVVMMREGTKISKSRSRERLLTLDQTYTNPMNFSQPVVNPIMSSPIITSNNTPMTGTNTTVQSRTPSSVFEEDERDFV
jgi:hypothetical protein